MLPQKEWHEFKNNHLDFLNYNILLLICILNLIDYVFIDKSFRHTFTTICLLCEFFARVSNIGNCCFILCLTRPMTVGHAYVFSMAVGTIEERLKLVPFCVRGRKVDSGGGGDGLVVF